MIQINIPQYLVKAVDDKLPAVFNKKTVYRDKSHAVMGIATEIAVIAKLTGDLLDIRDGEDNGYDLEVGGYKWDIKTQNLSTLTPNHSDIIYLNDYSYQYGKADGYIFCFTKLKENTAWILGGIMREEVESKFKLYKKGDSIMIGGRNYTVHSDKWVGDKKDLNEIL